MKHSALLPLLLLSLSFAGFSHSEEAPEPTPPHAKDDGTKFSLDLAQRMRRAMEKSPNGKISVEDIVSICRKLLKDHGEDPGKVDAASMADLMRMIRERAPRAIGDLEFLGGSGSGNQKTKELDSQYETLLSGHRPGVAKASLSSISLRSSESEAVLALGCVIKPGWALTKASEAQKAKDLMVSVSKTVWKPAKIVREWKNHDLALISFDDKDLPALDFSERSTPPIGSFITAAGPLGEDPVAIGVVSVAPRNMVSEGRGFLGVGLEVIPEGLRVNLIAPEGAAEKAGLKIGDVILKLNGKKFESVSGFAEEVTSHKAGETVTLDVLREGESLTFNPSLMDRGKGPAAQEGRFAWMNSLGTRLSDRRDEFPNVFQSDFPMNANECGGPVTDLDGNVLGLVIARAGRVDTLILPAEVIRDTVASIDWNKPEGEKPAAPAEIAEADQAPPTEKPKETAEAKPQPPKDAGERMPVEPTPAPEAKPIAEAAPKAPEEEKSEAKPSAPERQLAREGEKSKSDEAKKNQDSSLDSLNQLGEEFEQLGKLFNEILEP